MFEPAPEPPGGTKAVYVISAVRTVLTGKALSHEQLFAVTLRFIQVLSGSNLRYTIEPQVIAWAQRHWRAALKAPFGFKSPSAILPAVEAALEQEGITGVVATLLAAEPGLNVRLPSDFRQWLRTVG
jgi:hypothetical protein